MASSTGRIASLLALVILGVTATALASPLEPVAAGSPLQAEEPAEKIDVNRADELQLQEAPGIGPAMARRIVEWRQEHGPFRRLEDLLDIRGIGEKTLEKLRPWLEVGEVEESG